jgi:exopolysaccharide biosynthesis protein
VLIAASGASAASGAAGAADAPVRVSAIDRSTDAGPIRGFVATINLADPRVKVVVTGPLATDHPMAGAKVDGQPVEAVLVPTDRWAEAQRTVVAINANFFAGVSKSNLSVAPSGNAEPGAIKPADSATRDTETQERWKSAQPVDIVGLSISNGVVVSPARSHNNRFDPALLVMPDGVARIGYFSDADTKGAVSAVAGVGSSMTDTIAGTLLVESGKNLGATARVQPTIRHPRTAAGVTADGRTLILVVVDGRRPAHSVGMTLPELADLMIEHGAINAINLDGGGSSAFIYAPQFAPKDAALSGAAQTNTPSDGHFRPVANHLGITIVNPAPSVGSVPTSPGDQR